DRAGGRAPGQRHRRGGHVRRGRRAWGAGRVGLLAAADALRERVHGQPDAADPRLEAGLHAGEVPRAVAVLGTAAQGVVDELHDVEVEVRQRRALEQVRDDVVLTVAAGPDLPAAPSEVYRADRRSDGLDAALPVEPDHDLGVLDAGYVRVGVDPDVVCGVPRAAARVAHTDAAVRAADLADLAGQR